MLPNCDPSSSELLTTSEVTPALRLAETNRGVRQPSAWQVTRRWAEPAVRFRWQIATAGAVCVAIMSWLPWGRVAKSPEESASAPLAFGAGTPGETSRPDRVEPEIIPGLARARTLTADQIALSAPIPTPPRDTEKPTPQGEMAKPAVVPSVAAQVQNGAALSESVSRSHGTLKVRSQPEGATIVCDGREIGHAPLEWPLRPGRHEVSARWKGHDARTRTVTLVSGEEESLNFDFRPGETPAKSIARRSKKKSKKEDESMLAKVGRSVKDFFDGDKRR